MQEVPACTALKIEPARTKPYLKVQEKNVSDKLSGGLQSSVGTDMHLQKKHHSATAAKPPRPTRKSEVHVQLVAALR